MTSEEINKLKELKRLLDAGILTPEEVQAEKARILGNEPAEAVAAENEAPKVAQETKPKADGGTAEEDGGNSKMMIACGIGLLVVVLVGIVIGMRSSSTQVSSGSEYGGYIAPVDSDATVYTDDNDVAEYETAETDGSTATDDDEFAYDPWVGTVLLKGGVYRRCDTCVSLSLRKTAKGMYEGSLQVMLGYEMDETKFDPSFGMLTGTVRAKADGDVLTVVLDSYTTKAGDSGDDFTSLSLNGQVLRITNNGGNYTATAVGDMEYCFGGGDIYVSK